MILIYHEPAFITGLYIHVQRQATELEPHFTQLPVTLRMSSPHPGRGRHILISKKYYLLHSLISL